MKECLEKIVKMNFSDCYECRSELKKFRKYRKVEEYYEIPAIDGGTFIVSTIGEFCWIERRIEGRNRHICVARKRVGSVCKPEYNEKVVKFILANPHRFNSFFKKESEAAYEYGLYYSFNNLAGAVVGAVIQ